jgi:hypothetical protein
MPPDYLGALSTFSTWLHVTGKSPATVVLWTGMVKRILAVLRDDVSLPRLDEFLLEQKRSQQASMRTAWRKFCEYIRTDPDFLGLPPIEPPPPGMAGRPASAPTRRDMLIHWLATVPMTSPETIVTLRWGFLRRKDADDALIVSPNPKFQPIVVSHFFVKACREACFPSIVRPPETAPLFSARENSLEPLSLWQVERYIRLAQHAIDCGAEKRWASPVVFKIPTFD